MQQPIPHATDHSMLGVIPEFHETSKIASYLRSNRKGIKTRIQFISRETELFDRVSKYGSGHDLVASIREHFDASDECRFCEMSAVENVEHVMLSCSLYSEAMADLLRHIDEVFDLVKFHSLTPLETIVTLLGEANTATAKNDQQMFCLYYVTNNFLYKISVTNFNNTQLCVPASKSMATLVHSLLHIKRNF